MDKVNTESIYLGGYNCWEANDRPSNFLMEVWDSKEVKTRRESISLSKNGLDTQYFPYPYMTHFGL